MDDEKPDTRHLVLKPRDIVPMDPPSLPGDGKAISVQLIHRENVLADTKRLTSTHPGSGSRPGPVETPLPLPAVFKPKEITRTDPPVREGDEEAINVPEILLENRIAEEALGWGRVKWRKRRKSKRNRDFVLVVGTLDIAIGVGTKLMSNTVSTIYGIAAITLVTVTCGWIMFVVNDDY